MTISRINVNGSTTKADFLDLILSLQDDNSDKIVVMYKKDRGGILRDKKTHYERNLQNGQWYRTLDKGNKCYTRVRVSKMNRQYIIENV